MSPNGIYASKVGWNWSLRSWEGADLNVKKRPILALGFVDPYVSDCMYGF